jgi:NADH-quinone oxidoreductase subunit J
VGETITFWILAVISVVASLYMVRTQNPVRSALSLVVTFLCVAVFYVLLSAQFIAAVQIIVYAGAIMVLFLFVIMLLNLGAADALRERGTIQRLPAIGLGLIFIVLLLQSQSLLILLPGPGNPTNAAAIGTVQSVGLALFDPKLPWLFPFEITSILLLIAVVGAIIMAKRHI